MNGELKMKINNIMRKKRTERPLGYWEEQSYMMVIPKNDEENILKKGIERLSESHDFKVTNTKYDINGVVNLKILYENEEYEVGFYLGGISVPEYYLHRNFLFREQERYFKCQRSNYNLYEIWK